ncbi:MAG TPA: transposase [Chloroflexota bacterium]|nr:transposase [Chloroflexota bacterium]
MGPEAAKSFPGRELVRAQPDPATGRPAGRAKQAVDDGRRGQGDVFGAFAPADGAACTRPDDRRTIADWVDFLEQVEAWIPPEVQRVHAVVDDLTVHRAVDVLLFCLAHERWEFVFQPKNAAYLNLIEPWWKVRRSLALKGRRFQTREEICRAIEQATAYLD